MFLPQSLPLCPSGAPVSSVKFSVSHQYATQHLINIKCLVSCLWASEALLLYPMAVKSSQTVSVEQS